jgi:hypothetical protein
MRSPQRVTSWKHRTMVDVVVDALAMVDALAGPSVGHVVIDRLRGQTLHAPAHVDAEVFPPRSVAASERFPPDR